MPQTLGIIRTRKGVLTTELEPAWGVTIQPGEDPQGRDVPEPLLRALRLPENWVRIPANLWEAFRDLCFAYLNWGSKGVDSSQEVAVIWTRRGDNFREWEGWVPTQEVGGATVQSDLRIPLVNLLTGERVESLAALTLTGRAHAGSSHSHNTMPAFFSGIDDSSELGVPGLHCVLGACKKERTPGRRGHRRRRRRADAHATVRYDIAPSICLRGKRYRDLLTADGVRPMLASDLIEVENLAGPYASRTFHPNVLTVVSKYVPQPTTYTQGTYQYPPGIRDSRELQLEWPGAAGLVPASGPREVVSVYPSSVKGSDSCWAQYGTGCGCELTRIKDLPEKWQKILAAKIARGDNTSPPTVATPKVRLYRAEQAGSVPEALLLADMVKDTLFAPETSEETWCALVGALERCGLRYVSHTEAPAAGTVLD